MQHVPSKIYHLLALQAAVLLHGSVQNRLLYSKIHLWPLRIQALSARQVILDELVVG